VIVEMGPIRLHEVDDQD